MTETRTCICTGVRRLFGVCPKCGRIGEPLESCPKPAPSGAKEKAMPRSRPAKPKAVQPVPAEQPAVQLETAAIQTDGAAEPANGLREELAALKGEVKAATAVAKDPAKPAGDLPTARGLTKPQRRILAALCASDVPLSQRRIAEAAKVAESWVVGFTGKACRANRTLSLVEQGLAVQQDVEVEGKAERSWTATAEGRAENARPSS